jgi:hypothetical protein
MEVAQWTGVGLPPPGGRQAIRCQALFGIACFQQWKMAAGRRAGGGEERSPFMEIQLILMAAVSLWLIKIGADGDSQLVPIRERDRRRR